MRARIRDLLRYREARERQPFRAMFPLIVVLVESERQRMLWQQANRETTQRMRLSVPLSGVIVDRAEEKQYPDGGNIRVQKDNGSIGRTRERSAWSYNWRHLATNAPVRLAEQLVPMSAAALPPALFPQRVPKGPFQEATQRVLVRGRYMERVERLTYEERTPAKEREVIALLGLRMSVRYRNMLLLLHAHPLLSTEEVALFSHLAQKSAERYLYTLLAWGVSKR